MNRQKRIAIYTRLQERNPRPSTELDWIDPFELLIAVVLSAQATDVSVNKATTKLYPVANTPEKILALGVSRLKRYIRTIGLFNSKAENIIKTCRILVDEHGGQVPRTREALEKLPGVGRKTANVILNTAFGEPTIAVDTHIFRVANRTRLAKGKNPLEVETRLTRLTPPGVPQGRPPLAHPARPLRLQGPQARVPSLRHRRSVRVPGQDARTITFVTRPPRLGDNAVALEVLTPSFRHSRESGNPGGVGRRHRNR